MKFRIVYEGQLFSSQPKENDKLSAKEIGITNHKHQIRQQINGQLKNLFKKHPVLSAFKYCPKCGLNHAFKTKGGVQIGTHKEFNLTETILENTLIKHENLKLGSENYAFCPLVSSALNLRCSLDILLLRLDQVAGVYKSGDLDNRLKTLIDGLTMPSSKDQIPGTEHAPTKMMDPFYTILADDNIIDSLKVETDTLYKVWGPNEKHDPSWVTAIITVEVKPTNPNAINISFV
jgi:hypothetical protein